MEIDIEKHTRDECSRCYGRGTIPDPNPFRAQETHIMCPVCFGEGKEMRDLTDKERIEQLEHVVKRLASYIGE